MEISLVEVLQKGFHLGDGTGREAEVACGSFGEVVRVLHDVTRPTLVAIGRAVMGGREAAVRKHNTLVTILHTGCQR